MNDIFDRLKAIMHPLTHSLDVTSDEPGNYDVYTHHVMKNGKPQWFGGIKIQKNYVSYYLMPVYANPDLLKALSPALKKRMQGKSCFNFKSMDESLFDELTTLTQRSYEDYVSKGIVTGS